MAGERVGLSRVYALRDHAKGNLTIMTSLVFTILLGFAGLSIDASAWYSVKRGMQTAVDSAAMAAAYELSRDGSFSAAIASAEEAAGRNGFDMGLSVRLIQAGAAVEATLSSEAPQYLSNLFLDEPPVLRTSAAARITRTAICLLALEPEGKEAIAMKGDSRITAPGCRVQVNSSHPQAVVVEQSARIDALSMCVTGEAVGTANIRPMPDTGCAPTPDPLADLEPPAFSRSDCIAKKLQLTVDTTLKPGVYCGGLEIKDSARVTLDPGIYVITGGPLKIKDHAEVHGDGVAIYLDGNDAVIEADGHGKVFLKAPKTGPLAGIIFFEDPTAKPGITHKFKKSVEKHYEGTIYLPPGDVEFSGDSYASTTSPYSIYIARTFKMTSAGSITINENFDASDVPLPQGIDNERSVALVN